MLKRAFSLVPLLLILSLAAPARAQDTPDWTAWLHYGHHMTLIDSGGGVLREVDLPMTEDHYMQEHIAISPDGDLAAYIVHPDDDYLTTVLTIYDTSTSQVITEYTILGEYWSTPQFSGNLMFKESGGALAFGYGIYQRDNFEID